MPFLPMVLMRYPQISHSRYTVRAETHPPVCLQDECLWKHIRGGFGNVHSLVQVPAISFNRDGRKNQELFLN